MKFAELFTDGLIVQAGKPFRVFGTGTGQGTVTWQGVTKAVSGKDGAWWVEFDPSDYGGPYSLTAVLDGVETTLSDVMVGEVFLFSGQSNIQFHMVEEVTPRSAYRDDPMLRIFVCERMEAGETLFPRDGWVKAKPENIDYWSALAYLTGTELRKRGCAVGVVACSQGASVIQSWIPREALEEALDLPEEVLFADNRNPMYRLWNGNGTLYDFMLSRLLPYSFRAVVWYQGESNRSDAEAAVYDRFLDCLVKTWRTGFRDEKLPFVLIQLADLEEMRGTAWELIQKKQMEVQIPGVYCVPCRDICEDNEIHPPTKWRLAKRIYERMEAETLLPEKATESIGRK